MSAEQLTSNSSKSLAHRKGDYGFDAPYVPVMLAVIGLIFAIPGILALLAGNVVAGIIFLLYAVFMLLSSACYVYTTRVGKFQSWANILSQPGLSGDEQVLDMGCGRGAVLLKGGAVRATPA